MIQGGGRCSHNTGEARRTLFGNRLVANNTSTESVGGCTLCHMRVRALLGMVMLLSCLVVSAQEHTIGPLGTRPASYFPVQSKNPKGLAAGKLLVASRDLGDPHFVHTVVLLIRYDAQGVVGLVLNRRTDVPLSRALDGVKAAKERSDRIFLGGPVETPSVFALLQAKARIEGAEQIFDGVYLISAKPLFEQTISERPDPKVFRVYMGYAGWTKEQLQMEVQLGAWYIFPGDAATVFNSDPDSLWFQMIRKTELKFTKSGPAGTEQWTLAGQFFGTGHSR